MLVVTSVIPTTVKPPPTELSPGYFQNESLIYDLAIVPRGILAPDQVQNASAIYSHVMTRRVTKNLQPSQVVNASTIYVQTIAKDIATSYDNVGGKGNRTSIIAVTSTVTIDGGTLANLVDGSYANSMYWRHGESNRTLTFDVGAGKAAIIQEAKFFTNDGASHGTWKWRGSQNGADWLDLSVAFNFAAGFAGFVMGDLALNQNAYRFYQLFQVSGTTSGLPYLQEWEFKIAGL